MAMNQSKVCREPFLVFFPLGVVLAWAGVLPWLIFARGALHAWPGPYHAFTMTQGFLVALAVGFLGTMLPRRTRARPLFLGEILVIAAALLAGPVAAACDRRGLAEAGFVVVLATLVQYILRAVRGAGGGRPPPAHMWLPAGIFFGLGGALVLCGAALWPVPGWIVLSGQRLAQQGLMLCLVLGLSPMLSAILRTGQPPAEAPARQRLLRLLHGLAIAGLFGSFVIEPLDERAGLLLRGVLALAVVLGAARPLGGLSRRGVHRRLFLLALVLVPAGLLLAGADPRHRVAWMHVTLLGGLALLAFTVSVHVSLLHTGREDQAEGSPPMVVLGGLLVLAAAAARVSADFLGTAYVTALGAAALLWLLGGAVWLAFLLRLYAGRR